MNLDIRVKELERQLKWCKHMIGTMFVTVMVLVAIAAVPRTQSVLELVSPDGKKTVTLRAHDRQSGLWIAGQAAIIETDNGGALQLRDSEKNVNTYTADSFIK